MIVAASGTTGAGRSPRVDLLASEVMGSMSAYKVGGAHRHTPEIEQALTEVQTRQPLSSERSVTPPRPVTLSFTPTLAPMPRGILATATARLAPAAADSPDVTPPCCATRSPPPTPKARSCTCCPRAQWPATGAVAGSNGAHLQVAADPHAGRAVVIAATDNLGKGAAGQAVQIANLMLGLPETAGLTAHGVAP